MTLDTHTPVSPDTRGPQATPPDLPGKEESDSWAVHFEPGKSINPKNWGVGHRWFLTVVAGVLVFNSTLASSAPTGIVDGMIDYFGFSQEVCTLGWTSYPSIHWMIPVLAGAFIGIGTLGMFVSLFNYIIDVYLWSAASALVAVTIVRSHFGAAFSLFATQMYEKLGTQWASTLLGFLNLLMVPIPVVLMRYGHLLRAQSKFSPNRAGIVDEGGKCRRSGCEMTIAR
ncbi:hypothetical protein L198_06046 [Cryptococcus wingfieldii CBS 7118]|uniref:Major facilitator superfamily (MFS) profile domain-containing protein n=1 Tax=Cryptococcus wingfieldii CBS 7118 TaxID=1295528 RepID=A0A1E3IQ49_9TREE|nr:hypothetical protein L198_06046 [Cryptococcus wingfieldii CBS 7118]ODN90730.1 hypothetical protein L198_06046 [Cryptococcus wingfieldii CBS 7118]